MTASSASPALPRSPVVSVGSWLLARRLDALERVDFLGATLIATGRFLRSRTHEARRTFTAALRDAGLGSLPIVALMGCVAGLVLTLLATKELGKIGVQTAIPRLVGVVILREIGVLIVGVALAGRVASSYAAEIAAARGQASRLRPSDPAFDDDVAPRVLALVLATPLLLAYTNTMAVAGSVLYGASSLPMAREHAMDMLSALNLRHTIAGLAKAVGFGLMVALAGCYHGLRAASTPGTVGHAARRAVVEAVIGVGIAEVALIFFFKWTRF